MKNKLFLMMCALAVSTISPALDIRVMTYNIRYNNPGDGIHVWPNRKADVVELLRSRKPDVFGLQEALLGQINDIASFMPGYDWVGVGRDDGVNQGEYVPIFYNSQRYQLKLQGWFWLSETPDIPSKGWDAALPRLCTYVLLEDYETRANFWVFNSHFDHLGEEARKESARLILKKVHELNNDKLPVILTGDFNASPDADPIRILERRLNDSRQKSEVEPSGPEGTFNGFDFNSPLKDRIDYIFVNRKVTVTKYEVITDSKDQCYPSDHLPVLAELSLK
ncbi:endonuclease/exonuclease/phosphatase family protein [Gaoshiqia sp. Z1-71]|uniref:endonuclease/exonuclease/phosphatase family protein n=1 Tax=Gaoshiqia hydrogeniformans TaxID=3290090 RepID=UPI003BF8DA2D